MDKKQGMFELIERQQASGLSQKVFCEEEGTSYSGSFIKF